MGGLATGTPALLDSSYNCCGLKTVLKRVKAIGTLLQKVAKGGPTFIVTHVQSVAGGGEVGIGAGHALQRQDQGTS